MTELLERFFGATDWVEIVDPARDLSVQDDPADVPPLLAALHDQLEARRWGAVYALGFSRRDGRVVRPLIQVLRNKQETPRVRAQAAECLGMLGKRKAVKALIQCCTDESAEVRFWSVFALGQYHWRRNKPPRAVVRALESRLEDRESPDDRGNWWTVGLEALAMLRGRGPRHPAPQLFRDKVLRVFKDPLNHRDEWQWATWYWAISDLYSEPEVRALFDTAVRAIQETGFDPVRFGRQKTETPEAEPVPSQHKLDKI
ncbi:MAG: HEAT repeat domain-containing protein [Acidobacteria bacterium]|nr:HEAT repeat domain-containing protein [Acidobacteriota bacterium]MBI3278210.1 HEAT repeat domain-containing protein [Acidobacteriota bacterium]